MDVFYRLEEVKKAVADVKYQLDTVFMGSFSHEEWLSNVVVNVLGCHCDRYGPRECSYILKDLADIHA